jgi:hypothetical protein
MCINFNLNFKFCSLTCADVTSRLFDKLSQAIGSLSYVLMFYTSKAVYNVIPSDTNIFPFNRSSHF